MPSSVTSAAISSDPLEERTYIMIKPDGVQRALVGEVMERFENKGYKMCALKQMLPTRDHLEQHYADLSSKKFFPSLIDYMASGPVVCMVWEGLNAVKEGRKILGATRPADSLPGTIRGDLCIDVGRNACHGSDAVESAAHEIGLWFPEGIATWSSHSKAQLYEVDEAPAPVTAEPPAPAPAPVAEEAPAPAPAPIVEETPAAAPAAVEAAAPAEDAASLGGDLGDSKPWLDVESQGSDGLLAATVHPDGNELVRTCKNVLNFITIFGPARQGKSFFMNAMMGRDVFAVSSSSAPCTQGVHISSNMPTLEQFAPEGVECTPEHPTSIGFIDAEGSGDKTSKFDLTLVTPVLMASKVGPTTTATAQRSTTCASSVLGSVFSVVLCSAT